MKFSYEVDQIKKYLQPQDWVGGFEVRLREEGHLYIGEGFVIPTMKKT